MLKHSIALFACLLCHTAAAETIYKCTDGGKTSYNDRPCGQTTVALKVPVAQAPAPEALQQLARERVMLQKIEDARAAREEQEARDGARARRAALGEQRRCDKLRLRHKWAEEEVRRAGRDEAERARIKARRQAEVLAVECPA